MCYNCGERGHPAKERTKTGSKGTGKEKSKWKGGAWQVDGDEKDWNLEQPEGEEEGAIEAVDKWNYVPIRTKKFDAEFSSIDRPGYACAVSEAKGRGKFRAQVDSGATDAVGPKEIAKAFTMKENVLSKEGLGRIASNGSRI